MAPKCGADGEAKTAARGEIDVSAVRSAPDSAEVHLTALRVTGCCRSRLNRGGRNGTAVGAARAAVAIAVTAGRIDRDPSAGQAARVA
jgi:hypothetical protein